MTWKKFGPHIKAVAKAITYRLVGATTTFVATYAMTGKPTVALGMVGVEVLAKTTLFYLHERVWEIKPVTELFGTEEGE